MQSEIIKDILSVLKSTIEVIKSSKHHELTDISNRVIHNASIYQDEDSISTAVVIYAISKIIARCCEKAIAFPKVEDQISEAIKALEENDIAGFRKSIKLLIETLKKFDEKIKLYIEEVFDKAKIKKGSKIHEHGLTIARTAELLGVSQWELLNYIGKTTIPQPGEGIPVLERLAKAREIFK